MTTKRLGYKDSSTKLDTTCLFILGFQLSTAFISVVHFLHESQLLESRVRQQLIRVSGVLHQRRYLRISNVRYIKTKQTSRPFQVSFKQELSSS